MTNENNQDEPQHSIQSQQSQGIKQMSQQNSACVSEQLQPPQLFQALTFVLTHPVNVMKLTTQLKSHAKQLVIESDDVQLNRLQKISRKDFLQIEVNEGDYMLRLLPRLKKEQAAQFRIRWYEEGEKGTAVTMGELSEMFTGRKSDLFKKYDAKKVAVIDENCCLSLMTGKRSYDFEFQEAFECLIFQTALEFLIAYSK